MGGWFWVVWHGEVFGGLWVVSRVIAPLRLILLMLE